MNQNQHTKTGGRDDAEYIYLLDLYKQHRRQDGPGALTYLDRALRLAQEGDVSHDALLGGAYL